MKLYQLELDSCVIEHHPSLLQALQSGALEKQNMLTWQTKLLFFLMHFVWQMSLKNECSMKIMWLCNAFD